MTKETMQSAMQIILHAGDARVATQKALEALAEFDFASAKSLMKEAQKKITEAHKIQTDTIQEETQGKKSEYSLLFAHAQDTLMTIYSEINIAKMLITLMESTDKRFSGLEKEK